MAIHQNDLIFGEILMSNRIEITQLQKADIIVSTGDSNVSKAIRIATSSDVSHTILYLGSGMIIESIEDGVTPNSWENIKNDKTLAIAFRYKGITVAQTDSVVENASDFKGRKYDVIGATGAGMFKRRGAVITGGVVAGGCVLIPLACPVVVSQKIVTDASIINNARDANKDKKFFCSELVGRAFQLAGLSLVDGVEPTFLNPGEVRLSSKLDYLGHLISG